MKSKTKKIGIIGGSGVENLLFMDGFKQAEVKTEYGEVTVKRGKVDGRAVVFLNRHGWEYTPPSQVNYRANIMALKDEEVNCILATAAVGSLHKKLQPGDLVILEDFIDLTRQRAGAFKNSSFLDMSTPYSHFINQMIQHAAKKIAAEVHPRAIYACTEGPRFETRAEIRMLDGLGADVVGMTQVPEVVLAAEAGIPYGVIGVVTNYAAGVTTKRVSSNEVLVMMRDRAHELSRLVHEVVKSL
ncbi:MTAP family purine nucleoside phosphorylase [Candidatus Margulisiibacteriota bacterium]